MVGPLVRDMENRRAADLTETRFAFLKNVHYNSSILKLEQEYFQVKVLSTI